MIRTRNILFLFLPAIAVVGFTLFIRVNQIEKTGKKETQKPEMNFTVPLFPDDPVIGNKKAPKTLVTFEDFGCESCKVQSELLDEVMKKHPDQVKIIWKGLPVTRFPFNSRQAHTYAFCAAQVGKFNEFKEMAFANSNNLSETILKTIAGEIKLDSGDLQKCIESGKAEEHIGQVEQVAKLLDIQAVPTIFFENKQLVPPNSVAGWESLLQLQQ